MRLDVLRGPKPTFGAVAFLFFSATIAVAQTDPHLIVVGGRPWSVNNTCANAPTACQGATSVPRTPTTEFDVRLGEFAATTDTAQFTLRWPAAWALISSETCGAELVRGIPSVQGSGLVYKLDSCEFEAFLDFVARFRFSTPVAGTLELSGVGGLPSIEYCDGYSYPEYNDRWVNVGSVCGMAPAPGCDDCSSFNSVQFYPSAVQSNVISGTAVVDTIRAYTHDDCSQGAECGGSDPTSCFTGFHSTQPWLSCTELPGSNLELRVDAAALPLGTHVGRIDAPAAACGGCYSSCLSVTVVVFQNVANVEIVGEPVAASILGPVTPNPASEEIRFVVNAPSEGEIEFSIVDLSGRSRSTWRESGLRLGPQEISRKLDHAALGRGMYFLVATGDGWSGRSRFVFAN